MQDPVTDAQIMAAVPDKKSTLTIMSVTRLLSEKATKSLGDFENQQQFDPNIVKLEMK